MRCGSAKTLLKNKEIDQELVGRPIKRLGDYLNSKTPLPFGCEECNHIWYSVAWTIIIRGSGCPKCAHRLPIDNAMFDSRTKDRPIKRLGNVSGSAIPTPIQCMVCEYIWSAIPHHVMSGHGCPRCVGLNPLTNEVMDERTKDRPIKRLGDVKGAHTQIPWQCLDCDHVWKAKPNDISNGRGCPQCNCDARITNDTIDQLLIGRSTKRGEDYKTGAMLWICTNCDNNWRARANNVIHHGSDCPLCFKPGKTEKALVRALKECGFPLEYEYNIKGINVNALKEYRLDIYYEQFKFAIEYNGKQHYGPSRFGGMSQEDAVLTFNKQQERDAYVDQFCKDNDITLLWIDGRKYNGKKLLQYIQDAIIPMLQSKTL